MNHETGDWVVKNGVSIAINIYTRHIIMKLTSSTPKKRKS